MKARYLLVFLLFAYLVIPVSCSEEEYDNDIDLTGVFPYKNPDYPVNADSLRILVLGNSFCGNSVRYLGALVDSSSIDKKQLGVYVNVIDGSGIDTWIDECESTKTLDFERVAGDLKMESHGDVLMLLAQKWDVIIFTQVSSASYLWGSFQNLPKLIRFLTVNCGNPDVCLVYNIPWSHTPEDMPWMLDGNFECCSRMTAQCGIDQFIPVGTAVQLARSTRLNDSMYLTLDKWHLNEGMGQYVASCTWFQKLIAPVFNVDIVGNKAKPKGNYSEADIQLAQKCAHQAMLLPFNYNVKVE